MNNTVQCPNCKAENPFYVSTCNKCNGFIHDKVPNIDLWNIIARLIYSPVNAFRSIIKAQHKNFIFAILLFASVKFSIDAVFMLMIGHNEESMVNHFFFNGLIILVILLSLVFLFSFLLKIITSPTRAKTRFKDNLAIFSYSLLPHAIGLCILFPVELIVFGGNLFSSNPSPFSIKETVAYMLSGFEVLIILWSMFLAVSAIYAQTRDFLFSILTGSIFIAVIFYAIYLVSPIF